MKTILTTATALLLVAACTPAPQVCERTVGMSKEGIPIVRGEPCVIAPIAAAQHIDWPRDDGRTERPVDVSPPTMPEEPTAPPVEPPSGPEAPPVTEPPVTDDDKHDRDDDKHDRDDGKRDRDDDRPKGGKKHDRAASNKAHSDNFVDAIGYLALASEMANG